jgi:hypothetical protein
MIALEREASLRVEPGTPVEIACLSGVVWITHAGDPRDLFLAPGESLVLPLRGLTLVTALEPATVRVLDRAAQRHVVFRWWSGVAHFASCLAASAEGSAIIANRGNRICLARAHQAIPQSRTGRLEGDSARAARASAP